MQLGANHQADIMGIELAKTTFYLDLKRTIKVNEPAGQKRKTEELTKAASTDQEKTAREKQPWIFFVQAVRFVTEGHRSDHTA